MGELVLRMVLSLCIVLGLLLLAARIAGKRYRANTGSTITVLQRQALSRGSTVTVVSVGSRVLVLGTTEQQVRVLTELDPGDIALPEGAGALRDAVPGRLYAVPPAPVVEPATADFAQVLLQAQESAAAPTSGTTPATSSAATPTTTAPGRHAARHRAPAAATRATTRTATPATADGALSGSLLSPQTWRQAFSALSGRAS